MFPPCLHRLQAERQSVIQHRHVANTLPVPFRQPHARHSLTLAECAGAVQDQVAALRSLLCLVIQWHALV